MNYKCTGRCALLDTTGGGRVAAKPGGPRLSAYERGYKRCGNCLVFVRWDGRYCPCCGTMLRVRARAAQSRSWKKYYRRKKACAA